MTESDFFTTKRGIIVLAFMIFITAYKGYYFALTIFSLLLLLFLLAPVFARASAKKLELGLKREVCMFQGATAKLELEIENKKLLPVVQVEAELTPELKISANWVRPFEKLCCSRPFSLNKRGVIKGSEIKITVSDALNLSRYESALPPKNANSIIVYPRVIPVKTEPLLQRMSELEKSKNGFICDKTLINNVASYQDGMSVKDINQRLLARTDEMYVNVYEKLSMRRICIIADFESFVTRTEQLGPNGNYTISTLDEEGFETMLSAIGSAAAELTSKDIICTLVLPAYGGQKEKIIVPNTIEEQTPLLLRSLAAVSYKDEETGLSPGLVLEEIHRLGKIIVLFKDAPVLFKDDKGAEALGLEYIELKQIVV